MSATTQTRMGKQITFRIDDNLERRLNLYINSEDHTFQPNQSDVLRKALDEFLPSLDELEN